MLKTVDNFDLIANNLLAINKPTEEEFYFLQVLTRGKDGNKGANGNNNNRLLKFYNIHSKEQLLDLKEEIISLCKINNARAYINPTKRNYKEVANAMMEQAMHTFISEDYKGLKRVYSKACGQSYLRNDKKFIVDLDGYFIGDKYIDNIKKTIYKCRGRGGENSDKIFMIVPTKHGCHLITWPFDISQFSQIYPNIDIHKNNPTLLYYSWEE
jgi:hypothetical protein